MKLPTRTEPIALGAVVYLAVNLLITGLTTFGAVSLTSDQTSWVYLAANVITTIAVAIKTRSIVWAPASVEDADYSTPTPGGIIPPTGYGTDEPTPEA